MARDVVVDGGRSHTGGVKQVDLVGVHVEEEHGAVVVVLREHDEPHRVLPVIVGGLEATAIVMGATDTAAPRPLTHDLMASLVDQLGGRLERVEVTELADATFYADLVLAGPAGALRVDARPSDAIALAMRTHVPVFVSDDVLDEAGAELVEVDVGAGEALDPEQIDAEIDQFREFLTELEPADFAESGDDTDDRGTTD